MDDGERGRGVLSRDLDSALNAAKGREGKRGREAAVSHFVLLRVCLRRRPIVKLLP